MSRPGWFGTWFLRSVGQLLCTAAVVLYVAWAAGGGLGQAAAAADGAPLGLTVGTAAKVQGGDPVTLSMTVTNQTGRPCVLSAEPFGTVTLDLRRDGVRLSPALTPIDYLDGVGGVIHDRARTVPAGGTVTFTLASEPGPDGMPRLRSVSGLPNGQGVAASWPVGTPGGYTATVEYAMPGGTGACTGISGNATVSFTVTDVCKKSAVLPILVSGLGGGGAVLWLAGMVRVRPGRRAVRRPLAVALGAVLLGAAVPTAARASITYEDGNLYEQAQPCIDQFRTNDPAHILPDVLGGKLRIRMKRDHYDWPFTLPGKDGYGADVTWAPGTSGNYVDGVPKEDCSGLYHELVHAFDFASGQMDSGKCGTGKNNASLSEIRATRAENLFRRSHKPFLDPRTTYSGQDIPPGSDPSWDAVRYTCMDWPGPPKPPPGMCFAKQTRSIAAAAGEPATGAGCAVSNGDPHLATFDGRLYDFQAVGEFELVKAAGMEIQARQTPFLDSRTVSVNSALAMLVGTDRLTFDVGDGLRIRLNGTDIAITAERTRLPGDGTISYDNEGQQYVVDFPNGAVATVDVIGDWALRVTVYPPASLRGKTEGLFGDFSGDPDTDLVYRGGGVVPEEPSRAELYSTFADGWRVTDADSLLPYPPGRTTASYTDKSFPDKEITVADLDPSSSGAARAVCAALGVTSPAALDACVLDTAVTGQPAFATDAAATDREAGPATRAPASGVRPGGTVRDGTVVSGDITTADQTDEYHLATGPATVIRVADEDTSQTSSPETLAITINPEQSQDAPGFWFTSPDPQFRVDPSTAYTLRVTRTDHATGHYRFVVVTAKENSTLISLGGTTAHRVAGDLESRGRVDIYRFRAPVTGRLHITGGTSPTLTMGLTEDSPQPTVLVPHPVDADELMEPMTAGQMYDLVVWSEGQLTGGYAFTMEVAATR